MVEAILGPDWNARFGRFRLQQGGGACPRIGETEKCCAPSQRCAQNDIWLPSEDFSVAVFDSPVPRAGTAVFGGLGARSKPLSFR